MANREFKVRDGLIIEGEAVFSGTLAALEIIAQNEHLILSSSAGSIVYVSGSLGVEDKVGIGTPPTGVENSVLEVIGRISTSGSSGGLQMMSRDGTSGTIQLFNPGDGFHIFGNDGPGLLMVVKDTADVGIGVGDSPNERLSISGSVSLIGTGSLYSNDSHLILSSSAGSIVHVSGALEVLGSAVFNTSAASNDFRVASDTNQNIFFVDGAGSGKVGIGTATPSSPFHITRDQVNMAADNPLVLLETTGSAAVTKGAILHLTTSRGGSTVDTDLFKISNLTGTLLTVRNDGSVGIGVASPTSILSLQMGTGTGVAEASGKANVNTTAVGTDAATTEKDLITYSLPANSLSVNDKLVKIQVWGTTGANGNTKTIKLYFGATVVRQIGPTAPNNQDWRMEAIVVRTGATAQDAIGTEMVDNSNVFNTHTEPAEDNATATIIKVTGQNGTSAANDIVAEALLVEYLN